MAVFYVGHGRLSEVLKKFKEEYLNGLSSQDLASPVLLKLVSTGEDSPLKDLDESELREKIMQMMEELE